MKIRLLSDLHLELYPQTEMPTAISAPGIARQGYPLSNLKFKKNADVVILAGDIGNPYQDSYINLLRLLSLTHTKVFVITGNHEYYNKRTMSKIDHKIKKLCLDEDNIHFLQTDSIVYNRVKFIGCTLWSNPSNLSLCKYMNDFNRISTDDQTFTFDKYVSNHLAHKSWLETELDIAKDDSYDKVCVITHHLPSYALLDVEYIDHPLNSFFATDINTTKANVWCYGHTHKANHTKINNTEFHCNPRGYAHETSGWDIDYVFKIE